jgi:radical SAM superfamily enzyme YgiQ (UPF0313 family)
MYTKLDDQRQAKFIVNYITEHPGCSIKEIVQECVTNRTRLKYLESQGYIVLPKWTYSNELDKRFKNRTYVSVTVGREHGKWT